MPRKQSCLKSDNKSRSKMIDVRKHFVSFDDLEVLEFETILGDNPAVSAGPPVAIGETLTNRVRYDVDVYEFFNPSSERPQRTQLVLAVPDRAALLINAGYNLFEIADATIAVQEVKRQRLQSFKQSAKKPFGVVGRVLRTVVHRKPMKPLHMWAKSA